MQLGIFARIFPRPSLEDALDSVQAHGFEAVQFNLSVAGLPTLPNEPITDALLQRIRDALNHRDLTMAAVSGTFNLIHPDPDVREAGFLGLEHLARAARGMGTTLVTLCTGTFNRDDMWSGHPENAGEPAWTLLRAGIDRALELSERHELLLGIEPEQGNVVDSATRARRLLDEAGSDRLGIIMDPTNLLQPKTLPRMREIIQEAMDLLGDRLILAHVKEIGQSGRFGDLGIGKGILDLDAYFHALDSAGYDGPLILHGMPESEVAESLGSVLDVLHPEGDEFEDDDA